MKMYEIAEGLEQCFDPETGEITDIEKFEELQGAWNDKIEAVGCMIKNRMLLVDGLKAEKKRITDRISVLEREIEGTKDFLDSQLQGRKFETAKVRMTYRKSASVDIEDANRVPEQFVSLVSEIKVDKMAVKKALQNGEAVEGCTLVEKNSLSVK